MSFNASIADIVETNRNKLLGCGAGWPRVRLGDVASILNGFAFSSKYFTKNSGRPLLRIRDIYATGTEINYNGPYDPIFIVRAGDLVVGMDGDFNAALWRGPEALLNQRVCKVAAHATQYNQKLLAYVLPGYLSAIHEHTSSITVKHLSSRTLADIPLPFPPLTEQAGIVAEIEKQLSRIDAATAACERIDRSLVSYRSSVLREAMRGHLTATWRNKIVSSSGQELLTAILSERRRMSAAYSTRQLVTKGRTKARVRYVEPMQPDISGLPILPNSWIYVNLELLTMPTPNSIRRGPFGGALKKEIFVPNGYKVYEQQHAITQNFELGTYYIDEAKYARMADFHVSPGDLIVSCSGTIGRVAVVPCNAKPGVINQALLKLTLNPDVVDTKFFLAAFEHRLHALANRGTGMNNLSGVEELKRMAFPLPPIAEQRKTVELLEMTFSRIGSLAATIEDVSKSGRRMRASILSQAFTGRIT